MMIHDWLVVSTPQLMVINGDFMMVNNDGLEHHWLVVVIPTPLKNDGVSSSVGMMTFPI